jgi:ABC-type Fe3+/spermidine/putrescine transport system ATPase subunit
VKIGIRPEQVSLSRSAQRHGERDNILQGTVSAAVFSGASMRYQVQLHDGALQVHGPTHNDAFNVGDAVTLHVPAEALQLFPHIPD